MTDHEQLGRAGGGLRPARPVPRRGDDVPRPPRGLRSLPASLDEHDLVAAQLGSIAMPEEPDETPSWAAMRDAIVTDERSEPQPSAAAVVDLSARRHRYAVSRRVLAAAAAVVVLVGGGIVAWQATSGGSSHAVPAAVSCGSAPDCHAISLETSSGVEAAALTVQGRHDHDGPHEHEAGAGRQGVRALAGARRWPPARREGVHRDRRPGCRDRRHRGRRTPTPRRSRSARRRPARSPASPTTPLLAAGTAT